MVAADKKASLYVIAERVQAKTKGERVVHLLKGDLLTDDVSAESVAHLKELGFVSETSPFDGPKPE